MISYIKANISSIIILVILIIIVALIIRKMIKDKKQGKTTCGCDCSSCNTNCPHKKQG